MEALAGLAAVLLHNIYRTIPTAEN